MQLMRQVLRTSGHSSPSVLFLRHLHLEGIQTHVSVSVPSCVGFSSLMFGAHPCTRLSCPVLVALAGPVFEGTFLIVQFSAGTDQQGGHQAAAPASPSTARVALLLGWGRELPTTWPPGLEQDRSPACPTGRDGEWGWKVVFRAVPREHSRGTKWWGRERPQGRVPACPQLPVLPCPENPGVLPPCPGALGAVPCFPVPEVMCLWLVCLTLCTSVRQEIKTTDNHVASK